jgi:GNAT superfamily N-acetyltransferase
MNRHLIRPATPNDWEAILPLLRAMGSQHDARARRRFARFAHHNDHYLPVAFAGEQLAGYGWVQDYGPHLRSGEHTARLHDLFVVPDRRREGIGAALFTAMKAWAEQRGMRYLEWQASQAALPFYAHLGYVGDPCPQPEFPFFCIEFSPTRSPMP